MVVIAVSIATIPWGNDWLYMLNSVLFRSLCMLHWKGHTIIPFYRKLRAQKASCMSKKIELSGGKAQPNLKPDLSECSKMSSQLLVITFQAWWMTDSPALCQKLQEWFLHSLEPHHTSEFSDHRQNVQSPSYNVRGLSKMQNVYKALATM